MNIKKTLAAVLTAAIVSNCFSFSVLAIDSRKNVTATEEHGTGNIFLTEEELNDILNERSFTNPNVESTATLPSSWDLTNSSTNSEGKNYFPSIGYQGELGSCVSWAATYYQYTYAANRLNKIETTSSNAYSPSWTFNFTNGGTNRGTKIPKVYSFLENHGALRLEDMPYNIDNYDYSWSTNTEAMISLKKSLTDIFLHM